MGDLLRSPAVNLSGCIGRVNSAGCIGICDKLMENLNQSDGVTNSKFAQFAPENRSKIVPKGE